MCPTICDQAAGRAGGVHISVPNPSRKASNEMCDAIEGLDEDVGACMGRRKRKVVKTKGFYFFFEGSRVDQVRSHICDQVASQAGDFKFRSQILPARLQMRCLRRLKVWTRMSELV